MANGMQPQPFQGIQTQRLKGPSFLESLFGGGDRISQIPRFNPEQMSALQQLLQQGLGMAQDPYQGFAPIEQEAQRSFQEQGIPSIMERFTQLGGGRSSALSQQLAEAQSRLQQGLGAQRAQFGQQNLGNALNLLQLGLQPQQETFYQPGTQGLFPSLLGALGGGLGSFGGTLGALSYLRR